MEGDFIKINEWLLPLSWLYGIGVRFRNFLFDAKILKSRSYQVPVISVGNITVGGTGKTPHVEYLARLLKDHMKVAVLSRGYKRKSHGFFVAEADTPMKLVGDEPYQMKQKFPEVTIAVDKKRTRGIDRLTSGKGVEVILLDDAFQHRYVKPGLNILLVDYHRLIIYDKLLPAGRLREPLRGKDRADIVIVTKCPKGLKPMDFRSIMKSMQLFPYQKLFFTTLDYEPLQPLFGGDSVGADQIAADEHAILLMGIASPRQLQEDLEASLPCKLTTLSFPDHHNFRKKDIRQLNEVFAALPQPRRIITTEKDAARLLTAEGLSDDVRKSLYVLPVHISFLQEQEEVFNKMITDYVRKNSRNSSLAKGKNGYQAPNSHYSGHRPGAISFRNY